MQDKEKRVRVFDKNALAYDRYRPKYPSQTVDDIFAYGKLGAERRILEIGSGTGQITLGLAEKGGYLTAIEKGATLAKLAAFNLRDFGKVQIITNSFEKWETEKSFDLAVSAQAFHWIEMEYGLQKVAALLKPGGTIALIWNVDLSQETAFWQKTSPLYEQYLPSKPGVKNMEDVIKEHEDHIQKSSFFEQFTKKEYYWEKIYAKENYLGLLGTFSPHMTLPELKRKSFFAAIERIIDEQGGKVLRKYKTVALLARRVNLGNGE